MEGTGGALSPEKNWWYLVDYVWYRGKWIANDAEGNYDLIASGPTGQRVSLSRLSCSDSSEMLGVWVAPNGNKTKQISILKEAAIDWGGKIKLSNGSPREAWTALHTNISAKLKYPLPACTLNEQNVNRLCGPLLVQLCLDQEYLEL